MSINNEGMTREQQNNYRRGYAKGAADLFSGILNISREDQNKVLTKEQIKMVEKWFWDINKWVNEDHNGRYSHPPALPSMD